MFLNIIFIFVIQICYSSATCDDGSCIELPIYAISLIGITISALFFTTIALAMIVYRLKRSKSGDDHSLFENIRHVSISKYERQPSGDSQRKFMRDSICDDISQLNLNESRCDEDDKDRDITDCNDVKIETEPKTSEPLKKIKKQAKVSVFPQLQEEQMNEIIKAVLNKQRIKECTTSLTDLDKIVNDAKDDATESKTPDISASTPVLDLYDDEVSVPIPKLPVYEADSKESKLRDEMKARFNQDEFRAKFHQMKPKIKENEIVSNKKTEENRSIQLENNRERNELKPDQGEINSKLIKPGDEGVVQDEIYDFPPPPKPQSDIYDYPPSPIPHDELYDVLPSPKFKNDVSSLSQSQSELYDFPPSPKPHSEIYECPPPSRIRNIIVHDDEAAGYLYPLTNSDNVVTFNDPQYSNAKSVPDQELL